MKYTIEMVGGQGMICIIRYQFQGSPEQTTYE